MSLSSNALRVSQSFVPLVHAFVSDESREVRCAVPANSGVKKGTTRVKVLFSACKNPADLPEEQKNYALNSRCTFHSLKTLYHDPEGKRCFPDGTSYDEALKLFKRQHPSYGEKEKIELFKLVYIPPLLIKSILSKGGDPDRLGSSGSGGYHGDTERSPINTFSWNCEDPSDSPTANED